MVIIKPSLHIILLILWTIFNVITTIRRLILIEHISIHVVVYKAHTQSVYNIQTCHLFYLLSTCNHNCWIWSTKACVSELFQIIITHSNATPLDNSQSIYSFALNTWNKNSIVIWRSHQVKELWTWIKRRVVRRGECLPRSAIATNYIEAKLLLYRWGHFVKNGVTITQCVTVRLCRGKLHWRRVTCLGKNIVRSTWKR